MFSKNAAKLFLFFTPLMMTALGDTTNFEHTNEPKGEELSLYEIFAPLIILTLGFKLMITIVEHSCLEGLHDGEELDRELDLELNRQTALMITNRRRALQAQLAQNAGANLAQNAGANPEQNAGVNLAQNVGANPVQNAEANPVQDAEANPVQDAEANHVQDAEANHVQDAEANPVQNAEVNHVQNAGANLVQNAGANLLLNMMANIRRVARSLQQQVTNPVQVEENSDGHYLAMNDQAPQEEQGLEESNGYSCL